MSAASRANSLRECMKSVDDQIEAGCTFGQVEDYINARSLDEEHKAALWLWAWSQQSHEDKRAPGEAEVTDARESGSDDPSARLAEFSARAKGRG
jgi:hypothetical protein